MLRCPHCQQPGISPLRKAILSPGLLASCKLCQGESTLRYKGWLTAMTPGTLLMIAALFVDDSTTEWILNGVGMALIIALPLWFAPLHKD